MNEAQQTEMSVVDRNGTRGTLDLAAMPPDGKQSRLVLVRFGSNAQAFIASEALVALKEGGYFYPESFGEAVLKEDTRMAERTSTQKADNVNTTIGQQLVVPLVAEELNVEKRRVERGLVRIIKTVSERTETIDLPLMEEHTEVERVAIGRIVESAPPVRYEGDVMIVPLLEEVIVTEKRLMLREELHIRKRQIETHKPQQVTLRREEATVERVGGHQQPED
ncbi:MAG: YsnF/AvaK domain-containing protein [Pyrinomonadaceae bacterium]